jgi:hypothetical protein
MLCVSRPPDIARYGDAQRRLENRLLTIKDFWSTTAWDPKGIFKKELDSYPFMKVHKLPLQQYS